MKMLRQYLGNTGLLVSRAGFGVLPMGPSQLALPLEEGAEVLLAAMQAGINFFDTAEYYQTYPYLRRAMDLFAASGGAPDSLILSSKSLSPDYSGMMEAIEDARVQLGRDVIDIFLMHEVRSGQLEERSGAWQALVDARERGLVKAIGLSTHHVDVCAAASQIDDLDVVFPLLNYAGLGIRITEASGNAGDAEAACGSSGVSGGSRGIERFATADEMLGAIRLCREAGKGIYTMKAFGGGSLTSTYQKALDFVFSQPDVDAVMLGFGKKSELDDLLSWMDGTMDPAYNPDVSKKRVRVNQEDCEGCGACRAKCASGAIFWNPENGLAEVDQTKCITCGYCIPACPVRAMIMY